MRFPLGEIDKQTARELAGTHGFRNAKKHDSQDICFVPDGDYAAFIERYAEVKCPPGDFVDREGHVLGRHKGIIHYTLGQRRGLGIPAASRLYVTAIDPQTNTVVLGSDDDLYSAELTARQKHLRECWVVAAEGADKSAIETAIKTMPNYFADYDTTVTFITAEEMRRDHSNLPHGGFVIRTGTTGLDGEHKHTIEYRLTLDSNPEFTSGVLTALARAVVRLNARGETGCKTIFDLPPALLSPLSGEALRAQML